MMTDTADARLAQSFPFLFRKQWSARGLAATIDAINVDGLAAEFQALLHNRAPRRSAAGKSYFVGHAGIASSKGGSTRREEHCAIALVNLQRCWPRPGGGWFRLLDYQVPLKGRQGDGDVGKIDLLGVTDQGRLVIVELKMMGRSGSRSDAPPHALVEGLRYTAMVMADIEAIAGEAASRYGITVASTTPLVLLLAPQAWWRGWLDLRAAGDWGPGFARLISAVEQRTGVAVECMALDDMGIEFGLDGQAPRLSHVPALHPVRPGATDPIGTALALSQDDARAVVRYVASDNETAWAWADRHHADQLDGGSRDRRSPVLSSEHASANVLVPSDGSRAGEIRAEIQSMRRHRHFASLRSCQALAQSVFGGIPAFGRLDLLAGINAECGRPAFFLKQTGWQLEFEHEVRTLNEPRPTSIDVLLSSPTKRVAVECKFTEREFGTCSRPLLRLGERSYEAQRCDGSYRAQAARTERCALTSIGIRYWTHLPALFAWPADRDDEPCPFDATYQLTRNALAAVLSPDGVIDARRGHALVLYDARNPAFQPGGKADLQWEAAAAACLIPGLLRRLTWQRLLHRLADASELAWLVDGLQGKYGLVGA